MAVVRVGDRVRSTVPIPVHGGGVDSVIAEGRVHELDLQEATATFYHDAKPEWPNPFTVRWRDLEHA